MRLTSTLAWRSGYDRHRRCSALGWATHRLVAQAIRDQVRLYLGDMAEFFRFSAHGDYSTTRFDLPVQNVARDIRVFTISGQTSAPVTDFKLDSRNGVLFLSAPLPSNVMLVAEGWHHGLFSDDELDYLISDAGMLHNFGRADRVRYRDANGFIRIKETPTTLETMPAVEHQLVVFLAVVQCLWALSVDAATDIDVSTSDGTHIPRSQRFGQLRAEIDMFTDRYKELANLLGVGIYAIEQFTLRRVSYMTGRLVPVYKAREYDDTGRPQRLLPPVTGRDPDESGIPSPAWPGTWGV